MEPMIAWISDNICGQSMRVQKSMGRGFAIRIHFSFLNSPGCLHVLSVSRSALHVDRITLANDDSSEKKESGEIRLDKDVAYYIILLKEKIEDRSSCDLVHTQYHPTHTIDF